MRTGKHQFNYTKYAVDWAVSIMAGDPKCTLEKAYAIDRMFGVLVEQCVNRYKTELELAKNFSVMCGVYNFMRDEYEDFGKYLREEVEFLRKHKYDPWLDTVPEDEAYENYGDQVKLNNMISNRIGNLIVKSADLSLTRINQMPRELATNFLAMKQLALDTADNIRFYNNKFVWDELDEISAAKTMAQVYEITQFYDSQTQVFTNIIQADTMEYHQTLNNTIEQIRRLLDD